MERRPLWNLVSIVVLAAWVAGCTTDFYPNWFGREGEYEGPNGEHFDAKVNGTVWFPWFELQGSFYAYYEPWTTGKIHSHSFSLGVHRGRNPDSKIEINVDSVYGTGSYNLGSSTSGIWAYYSQFDTVGVQTRVGYYVTNSRHTGVLNITQIDTAKQLIYGTIQFDAFDSSAMKDSVIHLTEGAFIVGYMQ
jgi:hypothetical protein